jgi:hypothetical protein
MNRLFYLRNVNPLQGLDEWRLISLLNDGERGAYAMLQWLYRFIEKRNPLARAVKRRLISALGKLQWDIKTADAGEDKDKQALADKQAETLARGLRSGDQSARRAQLACDWRICAASRTWKRFTARD